MDIFYDFDGTLFNTYPIMVAALSSALSELGIKSNKEKLYFSMRQKSLGETIKNVAKMNKIDAKIIKKKYDEYEKLNIKKATSFDDVKDTLEFVSNRKKGRNFLLTHRDETALSLLKSHGLSDYFTDAITGKSSFPRKPNPASLNYLIKKNNVNLSNSYMVGDRNLDIDAAHNAHIKGILFDYDNLINVSSNPELKVNSFQEIINYLAKI